MSHWPSRTVPAGDVHLYVTDAGAGPPVVLLHGFPELAWSWRHQVRALVDAGYRAVAPDLRGFGRSQAPAAVGAYDLEHLVADVLAILDRLGLDRPVLVGHDWGADLAWKTALLHPERVRAVVGMSVPYVPRAPAPPIGILREYLGEGFYMVWFQEPGVADAALAHDVRRTLLAREVWDAAWAARSDEEAEPRPPWLSEEDLAVYVEAFTETGFTGGLNWYRNIDRNWAWLGAAEGRTIDVPALFLTGSRDPVRAFMPAEAMHGQVTDLRGVHVIEGAGHWVQQECADEVSRLLLDFLAEVGSAP